MQSGLSRPVTSSVDLPHPPLPITCPGILTDVEKRCKTTPSLSPRTKHIQLSYASKQATRFLCSLRQTFLQGWQIVLYCVWHNPASHVSFQHPAQGCKLYFGNTTGELGKFTQNRTNKTILATIRIHRRNEYDENARELLSAASLCCGTTTWLYTAASGGLWVSKQQSLSDLSAVTLNGLLCMYCGCLCGRQIYCCTFSAPSTTP